MTPYYDKELSVPIKKCSYSHPKWEHEVLYIIINPDTLTYKYLIGAPDDLLFLTLDVIADLFSNEEQEHLLLLHRLSRGGNL